MRLAFRVTVMVISTQNDLELRCIHRRRRVRVGGEAHMSAQRGRQNLMRCTPRAVAPPRLAAALLTAALAAGLAACSGGRSVNLANTQAREPTPAHLSLCYVHRPLP